MLDTSYLRPNRTIESILLSNKKNKKLVFIYNYEGIHFRLFLSADQMIDFFIKEIEPNFCFENDNDLDCALKKLKTRPTALRVKAGAVA